MAESSPPDSAIEPWSLNPDSDPSFTAKNVRAEIDTSSPFVSVRETANRFGGFGFWRPHETLQVSPSLFFFQVLSEVKLRFLGFYVVKIDDKLCVFSLSEELGIESLVMSDSCLKRHDDDNDMLR